MKTKKQKIIYKKIGIEDFKKEPPNSKKLYISKNKKVYFLDSTKKRIDIYDLSEDIIDLPGLKFSADLINSKLIISLEIDSQKIDKLFSDPIKIKSRKKMVLLFQNCIEQAKKEYLNSIQLGIMYSACKKDKIKENLNKNIMFRFHKGNLEWMKQMEKNSEKTNYIFPSDYIKIGSNFVDTKTGKIQENINKIPVRFRGGVLINDIDDFWMYDILNLMNVSKGGKIKENYFNTKANLILASKENIDRWESRIKSFNKGYTDLYGKNNNKNYFIIRSKSDHNILTYKQTINLDFLFVDVDYLISDEYFKLFEDYIVSESTEIEHIIECIRSDYIKCEKKVKKYTNPILSLFYWNRMCIDNYTINKMDQNKNLFDTIFSIESFYKWIQINSVPTSLNKLMTCINFLIKYKKVNLPLYDDNYNMVYLGDVIRFNLEPHSSSIEELKIEEFDIKVEMDNYQKTIYNYFIEYSQNKLDDKFNIVLMDTVNEMSLSSRSLTEPEKQIKENNCCICYENLDQNNLVVTKCNHNYCIDCSLKSIRFSDKCAYCREKLEPSDYSKITNNKNSKLYVLENNLSENSKNLVVCNNSNISYNLSNYSNSWYSLQNIDFLEEFNELHSGTLFIDKSKMSFIYDLKNLDKIVFFDSLNKNLKQNLINPHIFKNLSKAKIINLVYKNTQEDSYRCTNDL
mgnify:CR=1 FL=1